MKLAQDINFLRREIAELQSKIKMLEALFKTEYWSIEDLKQFVKSLEKRIEDLESKLEKQWKKKK